MNHQYSKKLQELRGIAALLVVFFHLSPHFQATPHLEWLQPISKFGFFGVDVFFVLSGIVVGNVARASSLSGGSALLFLYRRLSRIYLGYWPVLLFAVLTYALLFRRSYSFDVTTIKSILLLTPTVAGNILPTAWSLTYEIYFYLIVVGVYFFTFRIRFLTISVFLAALIAWNAYWFIFQQSVVVNGNQPFRFLLSAFCIEFFAGVVLAELWVAGLLKKSLAPIAIFLAGIGFYAGTSSVLSDRVEIVRVATYGVSAISICFLAVVFDKNSSIQSPKTWIESIGDSSYSLYLLHPILLDVVGLLKGAIVRATQLPASIVLVVLCALVLLFCWLWYVKIERPTFKFAHSLVT